MAIESFGSWTRLPDKMNDGDPGVIHRYSTETLLRCPLKEQCPALRGVIEKISSVYQSLP
jgi:hypothetical protein